jgi:hypothetical protein
MLKGLGTLIGLGPGDDKSSPVEAFGEVRIARRFGEEILRGTAGRRNAVQGIRDRLSAMRGEDKDELVDRILARLALFVFDLPASEKSHHSGRFGLLDHLLEVAHETCRELSSPAFRVSAEPSTNHQERPLWIYAGVVAALAHDIGKPMSITVAAPGGGPSWDPLVEPLRHFCLRKGIAQTGPEIWHYQPGRGVDGDERHIARILPLVLTPEVGCYLGPRLASVLAELTRDGEFRRAPETSLLAREVVKVVRRIDQSSSRSDRKEERPVQPESPRPAPSPKVVPPRVAPSAVQLDLFSPSQESPQPRVEPKPAAEPKTEEPAIVPADFWGESVPSPRHRRGDPVETERRLAARLDPACFLDLLRRMIVMRRLSRNNLYTEVYIRPDYVWVVLPRALRRVAQINQLPFDTEVLRRMLSSLAASPQVEPPGPGRVSVFMKPRPDSNSFEAVRIRTCGFLPEIEQARLGYHKFDIQLIDPLTPPGVAV